MDMDFPEHLVDTRVDRLTSRVISLVEAGDFRARTVTLEDRSGAIGDRTGVITPHRDQHGWFDGNDLAAQIFALAMGLASQDGTYAAGYFVAGGIGYWRTAPGYDETEPLT